MPPIRVVGFDHLVLRCADVERSLAFYQGEFGLAAERVDAWRRGEVPFPSVRITPTTLIDLVAAAPDGTNVDHFCLVVDAADLDAVAAAFPDARRADGLFGAQGYASGVYVHDPDGNTVELRSYA
jgi:catechol 2,3-dioxygenase-like lactoylglutathione lyase family enzyme